MAATDSISRTMGFAEWGALLFLSFLWGGSFFFVGVAVDTLPPFTIVALRVGLAAIALHAVLLLRGERLPSGADVWLAFAGMGFVNNLVPFSLIVWGQTQIASGLASILNATTPLFTVLVAHALTDDEKMGPGRVAGVAVGFGGVVLMIGPQALEGIGDKVLGQLAVLGAALCYALAGVYGRRFRRMGVPPLVTATGMLTMSTVMLVPLALAVERPWTLPAPPLAVWGAVAGLAFLSTALAYLFYFRLLASAGAANMSLVTFLIPVTAILLGVVVLGETLDPRHLAGMTLIGLGLAAIDGRPLARLSIGRLRRTRPAVPEPPSTPPPHGRKPSPCAIPGRWYRRRR